MTKAVLLPIQQHQKKRHLWHGTLCRGFQEIVRVPVRPLEQQRSHVGSRTLDQESPTQNGQNDDHDLLLRRIQDET